MKKLTRLIISALLIPLLTAEAQNVGIGTADPQALLHVNDGSVLFSAAGTVPVTAPAPPLQGAGRRVMWYPGKAAFRAGYVESTQWNTNTIGNFSTAMGANTIASGSSSFAVGNSTAATGNYAAALGSLSTASGHVSTAMGYNTTASGFHAVAAGHNTTASGDYATAMGYFTVASGESAVALGRGTAASGNFSTAIGRGVSTAGQAGAFIVGDDREGPLSSTAPNQMTMRFDGGYRLFTNAAATEGATITPNGDMIVNGSAATGPVPVAGAGRRMMWYAGKNAFRAGQVSGDHWDTDNVGTRSIAMGYNVTASGGTSVALGESTTASGTGAVALGRSTAATNTYATAMGNVTVASGGGATAMGRETLASGNNATSMGHATIAQAYASVALGTFNVAAGNAAIAVAGDPVLVVGNGTTNVNRSNALTLLRNGDLTIAGTLSQSSDARLKKEIVPLTGSLEKLAAVSGYHYYWKAPEKRGSSLQTGLLAQEVETHFPELVVENTQGMKSVAYTGLIPHLVEGVKELKRANEELKRENEQLRLVVAALEEKGIAGQGDLLREFSKRLEQLEARLNTGDAPLPSYVSANLMDP